MKEKLVDKLYRNWVAKNPDSSVMFREFRNICNSIYECCIVEDRKNTSMVLRSNQLDFTENPKMPEVIVIREGNPRVVLLIEEK